MAKILIIDDHALVLDVMQETLKSIGHEVRTAENGEAGLSSFKEFDPDVVLLDHDMPFMAGDEVVKRLKILKFPLRVIILTGNTGGLLQRRYRTLGIFAFLDKTCGLVKLKKAIEAVLADPQWQPGPEFIR